jgi:hypothetical protein
MAEIDYDYDLDDSLLDTLGQLIDKYKLELLTLVNKGILEKEGKVFTDVYTEEQNKKKREVYDRLKLYLIEEKRKELTKESIKGEDLLTEENLRKWIEEDGETFISIAIKYTGCLYTIVSKKAKEYRIEAKKTFINAVDLMDNTILELVKAYSIDDILNGIHKYITKSKHINEMTIREKVLMDLCDIKEELLEKDELDKMLKAGLTMRDIVERIGCSFEILKIYLRNYGLSLDDLEKNKESKGKQMRNMVIRKKYARY